MPTTGAFLILSFLGVWNNFVGPQLILPCPNPQPLAVAMNLLKGVYGTGYGLVMAGKFCSIALLMCPFLLLQKEPLSTPASGAAKG